MAGSGKTTFMQRINSYLHTEQTPPYVVNLDPAVINLPYDSNIDIRDSINYKEVMKQYNLGPNGGILTSLNLFTTKVDQVMGILEKRTLPTDPATGAPNPSAARATRHILVDTPGQIEVFVWSASGSILLETLASTFPTVIAYVIDTPRTSSTSTFMSNMLYACSILYKTRLPMILVFNKTDVRDAEFAKEWMRDFEAFQAALTKEEESGMFGGEGAAAGSLGGSGYMGSYLNSMSLMLEEFYRYLNVVGVSSMTGDGVDDFFAAVEEKRKEFERDYRPEFERRKREKEEKEAQQREQNLGKLMKDMTVSDSDPAGKGKAAELPGTSNATDTISEGEDEDEDDEEYDDVAPGDRRGDAALAARYKEALGTQETMSEEDKAFQRYLRTNHFG
ncbi:hypothetical protein KEM52_005741 [Ascosphaera acerosa]|nr:hypothetical protein KEM52_005741 [Ascosphaera acerosa]